MPRTIKLVAVLLLSTALMTPNAQAAEAPGVTISGVYRAQMGYANNHGTYGASGTPYGRNYKIENDTEVHVLVNGKTDTGLEYGVTIELEADVTDDAKDEGLNADKTYVWAESNFGRVEAGNNEPASAMMAVNAASIAHGTGGIDADNEYYINFFSPTGGAFAIHPDLPTADVGAITEDATKFSYFTPKANGFQGGLSFTPDEGNGGTAAAFTTDADGNYENVVGWGLTYEHSLQGVDVALALVGEFGQNELSTIEDMNAWQLGASLTYEGFSLAGSYMDWNDSYKTVGVNANDQYLWNIGIAYSKDAFNSSLGYINSRKAEGAEINQYESTVLSVDYMVAPGLMPYAEVGYFNADAGGTDVDNHGTVVTIGTYLIF